VDHEFPGIGRKYMHLSARRVRQAGAMSMLLAIEDVTAQQRAAEGVG
jgi:hypothetical protein